VTEHVELLQTFRFAVHLTRSDQGATGSTLGTGGFSECSGLDLEADVKEYLEGGRNDGVVRRVGRAKLSPIVLKRGMFRPLPAGENPAPDPAAAPQPAAAPEGGPSGPAGGAPDQGDTALWDWITGVVSGVLPVPRYNGEVQLQDPGGKRVLATWIFERGLPSKVTGPTLNARTGEIAMEELHIVHEGLRLKTATQGAAT
jgi:hypothetical protein